MSFMLSVDKKKTSQLSLEKPLKKWIEKQENCNVADFQEALNELDRLREEIRNVVEKTEAALNVHYKYIGFLCSLEKRVPISEQDVRIRFYWYDVFKQKSASHYSISFEKVNVLFNVAAFMSQIALQQNRALDESIKICAKYFQTAAGVFSQVKEELDKHPEVGVCLDLSTDSLNFFINLMLAQAQECYYEKALKASMKSGVLSKLAAQVSDYYEVCYNLIVTTNLKNVVPKKWTTYVDLKMAGFKALAYYEESKKRKSSEEFGQQVGYLRAAHQTLLNAASKRDNKSPPPELFEWFRQVVTTIENELNSAERDNSQIYHEIIPSEHQLKPLEKQCMVKPIPLDKEKFTLTVDPFAVLIPTNVKKAESIYSERKAEMLREIIKEVENHNETVKNTLSSMGLPGAIEAIENPFTLPQSLLEKMKIVQSEGGLKFLEEQIKVLDKMAQQTAAMLTEALKILDQEEKDDNEMRAKYKEKWTRTPSHILTTQLRQEAQKHKGNLEHARKSDQFIISKLESHRDGITKLSWTREQMSAALPSPSLLIDNNNNKSLSSIVVLKEKLHQLDSLLFNRETLLKELRDMISKDEVMEKIIKVPENEYETVFSQELQKYNPHLTKIRNTFPEQSTLLKSITEENQKFQEERKTNDEIQQRQIVLNQLDQAFAHYTQLKAYLAEGIQFYTKFQEILKIFKDNCSDFAFARQTEKQDLLTDIQSQESTKVTSSQSSSASSSSSLLSIPASSLPSLSGSSLSKPASSTPSSSSQSQPFQQPQYYQVVSSPTPTPQSAGPFYIAYNAFQQPQPQVVHPQSVIQGYMYQQPQVPSSFQAPSFGVMPQQQQQQQSPPPPYPYGQPKGYPGNRY